MRQGFNDRLREPLAAQLGEKIRTQREDLSAVRRGKRHRLPPTPTPVFKISVCSTCCSLSSQTRSRDRATRRFSGSTAIVLPERPLRLVARPLALERLLMLQRTGFVLEFAEGGNPGSSGRISCKARCSINPVVAARRYRSHPNTHYEAAR
jgi:hypothetical protein